MRIYTFSLGDGEHHAVAPDVPGAWATAATPEDALVRCRLLVVGELAAYDRLGIPLTLTEGEHVVDWVAHVRPTFAEELVPATRDVVVRALTRLRDLDAEMRAFLVDLPTNRWDARPGDGWSVRMTLDHVASGLWIIGHRLDVWPLDAVEAQRLALDRLVRRLRSLPEGARAHRVEHFGLNSENGRIAWTPRKVARVVSAYQEAWLAHLEKGAPQPRLGAHEDAAGDEEAPTADEIDGVERRGTSLLERSSGSAAAAAVPLHYRYYRLRLHEWPADPEKRWKAVVSWFCERVERQSEAERALVRLVPGGQLASVRQVLGLTIGHTRDHLRQMREAVGS
ncbi:MAG TPA: hypothetical protein VMJ92_00845 [Candidatus Limnocylindrales bacterium]|nr:hypothetical protein [Candidatus Limnocylindrales bacterium]